MMKKNAVSKSFDKYKIHKKVNLLKSKEKLGFFLVSELYGTSNIFYYSELQKNDNYKKSYKKFRTLLVNYITFIDTSIKNLKKAKNETESFIRYHNDFCDFMGNHSAVPKINIARKKILHDDYKKYSTALETDFQNNFYNIFKAEIEKYNVSELIEVFYNKTILPDLKNNKNFYKKINPNIYYLAYKFRILYFLWVNKTKDNSPSEKQLFFEKAFIEILVLHKLSRSRSNQKTEVAIIDDVEQIMIESGLYDLEGSNRIIESFDKILNQHKYRKPKNNNYIKTIKILTKMTNWFNKKGREHIKIAEQIEYFKEQCENLHKIGRFNEHYKIIKGLIHDIQGYKNKKITMDDVRTLSGYLHDQFTHQIPYIQRYKENHYRSYLEEKEKMADRLPKRLKHFDFPDPDF